MTALTETTPTPPADAGKAFDAAKAEMSQRAVWLADALLAGDQRNVDLFTRMYRESRVAYRDACIAAFGHEVTC